MNPEGLLLCSKEPATGPYPQPDESNLQLLALFLYNPFYCYSPVYT
jgi:hypothetical protein